VPIAVINFTNHTGDEQFDYLCAAIPNLLITNLEQSKYLSVLTWERMRDLLKILGKEDVHIVDEDLGFEICEMDDIHTVITGSFTKAGNMFVTEVKVLDVGSKKILNTSSSQGVGVTSILKIQIDELSQDIARNVSLYERAASPTEMRITEVTTGSLEAYNYFLRGREDYEKHYFDDAIKFLQKAIKIDSMFASAFLYLAYTYVNLGKSKTAGETYEKAIQFSSGATEKERLYIIAAYADDIERNPEKRYRTLVQLTRKYPKEKRAHAFLADYYKYKGSLQKAIEELHKALELDPDYGPALNEIAYRYKDIGDYSKAIEYFIRYASVMPGDANPFDSMGDLYFEMGELDTAMAQYKKALFVKSDFHMSYGKIAFISALREDYPAAMACLENLLALTPASSIQASAYVQKAFYNYLLGNFHPAMTHLNKAEILLEPNEFTFGMALIYGLKALIDYDKGELQQSQKHLEDCYDNLPDLPYNSIFYNFLLGLIELKQKNLDSAKTRVEKIKSLLPKVSIWYKSVAQFNHDLLYGELLLTQDSLDKSIDIGNKMQEFVVKWTPGSFFGATHIPYDRNTVACAYYRRGNTNKAILEYERLTDPDPNKRGRSLIRPTWHYELAKFYEEKGMKAEAIDRYERFLDIWKDADEDRPELIDAKKRLAKLAG
jgi:tetratricopeptide (TPR) repeat protein